ncbi:hypothetical protein Pla52o_45370 [Novipirellula galeiformis]|uniref:AAA+ ATPase domain-containing protein n=1 Tax=Novipirellula galeiformis TaxID=2528004 RepID=A0A5C6C8Z7_9BACT|nr:hypothetical protein [Novipirellula galeiformis]TWU20658.1 hypothetical protein Pla52o_45370 [Novipirellula galeiformis]
MNSTPSVDRPIPPLESRHGHRGGLPWAWCNLWRNPFGELTREERAELAVVDVAELAAGVQGEKAAVQLIGDCGRGKTTRMLALWRHFPDASYVYLDEDLPCGAIAEGNPLLIDEAQRLPRKVMHRIFAVGLPLVLATHRDLTRALKKAGYRVTTYHLGDTNDARLVLESANRRIEASRLGPGSVPNLSLQDANELVSRFGSDIRGIEGYLYEQVQNQAYSDGEMRFVDCVRKGRGLYL